MLGSTIADVHSWTNLKMTSKVYVLKKKIHMIVLFLFFFPYCQATVEMNSLIRSIYIQHL